MSRLHRNPVLTPYIELASALPLNVEEAGLGQRLFLTERALRFAPLATLVTGRCCCWRWPADCRKRRRCWFVRGAPIPRHRRNSTVTWRGSPANTRSVSGLC